MTLLTNFFVLFLCFTIQVFLIPSLSLSPSELIINPLVSICIFPFFLFRSFSGYFWYSETCIWHPMSIRTYFATPEIRTMPLKRMLAIKFLYNILYWEYCIVFDPSAYGTDFQNYFILLNLQLKTMKYHFWLNLFRKIFECILWITIITTWD